MVILLGVIAGILYRMGGSDNFNTKWRDLGVPVCMVLAMASMGNLHWSLILCFGALFGALTTYNKWVGYFFDRPDREVHLESWVMTGFLYGLAMLPYAYFTNNWEPFLIRTVITTFLVALISELSGNVYIEEGGRGFVTVASLIAFL
jgi:hypothetical protein